MEVYAFDEAIPAKQFYWLFTDNAGAVTYYRHEVGLMQRYIALYGVPRGKWTYIAPSGARVC